MIKSLDVIAEIKANESPIEIYKNVFNKEEVQFLLEQKVKVEELYGSANRSDNVKKKNRIQVLKHDRHSKSDELTVEKFELMLKERIPNCSVFEKNAVFESMNFYNIQNAYHIHSDTGKTNRKSFKQFIVPLEIVPVDPSKEAHAHTVIFNERVYFSSEYVNTIVGVKDPDYLPFFNVPTYDPRYYEGWKDEYRISREDAHLLWNNKADFFNQFYKGFSINTLYQWEPGDVVFFDRSLLHAAAELDVNNVFEKSGLLGLSYVD